jgi:hypothetical protein
MKHTGVPVPLRCLDEVGPDVIFDELIEMDDVDFERCWVALVIDLVVRDDVSTNELALLLTMVHERYRGGVKDAVRCWRASFAKGRCKTGPRRGAA